MANTYLQKICNDLGLWAASLMILKKDSGQLICVSQHNLPGDWEKIKYKLDGDSLNAQVFRIGEPIVLNQIDADQIDHHASKHPMTALAVLPVVKNGLVVGTLELIADQPGYFFDIAKLHSIDTGSLLEF